MALSRGATFAAIVGHADDPVLLKRSIENHLSIGVDWVFVSLNNDDPESRDVISEFAGSGRVRAEPLHAFGGNELDFLTAALGVVRSWVDPDWVIFGDTDEFYMPARASIRDIGDLETADVLLVGRYNMALARDDNGMLVDPTPPCASTLVVDNRNAVPITLGSQAEWLNSRIGPKAIARAVVIASVIAGGHDIVARTPDVRRVHPRDVLIAHAPFTTPARFRRKVEGIRKLLEQLENQPPPSRGMHWQYWNDLNSKGRIEAEFERQVVATRDIDRLLAERRLVTVADILAVD